MFMLHAIIYILMGGSLLVILQVYIRRYFTVLRGCQLKNLLHIEDPEACAFGLVWVA